MDEKVIKTEKKVRRHKNTANIKVQRVRLQRGYTQKELAEKAGLNLRILQEYEQGRILIDATKLSTILKLCNALECGIEEIAETKEVLEYFDRFYTQKNKKKKY